MQVKSLITSCRSIHLKYILKQWRLYPRVTCYGYRHVHTPVARDILRVEVNLPSRKRGKLAFVLYNVLLKPECEDYIRLAEEKGFIDALVNVGSGKEVEMKAVRNNQRTMMVEPEIANILWRRIEEHVPATWLGRKVIGLNEGLKFNRYDPGTYFKPHMDGRYVTEDKSAWSYITILVYLNENFKGGTTTFMNEEGKERYDIVPRTGMVLVSEHRLRHEGATLEAGHKCMIRTEVMYEHAPANKS